jgi:hypothetical protein
MKIAKGETRLIALMLGLILVCSVGLRAGEQGQADRERFPTPDQRTIQGYVDMCKRRGYATDTFEQLVDATKKGSGYTSVAAMKVLAYRYGERAKPMLKEMLDNPNYLMRQRSAELLASMGDLSGVPRMQKDFDAFVAQIPRDPNAIPKGWRREKGPLGGSTPLGIMEAMRIGDLLVRCGDNRVLDLAIEQSLDIQGPRREYRHSRSCSIFSDGPQRRPW